LSEIRAAEFLCGCPLICSSDSGTFPGVIIRFSYSELEQATGEFSDEHLIGVGGSSKVYRGQLADGKVVAVKKLRSLGGADEDYEFLSEVASLVFCILYLFISICNVMSQILNARTDRAAVETEPLPRDSTSGVLLGEPRAAAGETAGVRVHVQRQPEGLPGPEAREEAHGVADSGERGAGRREGAGVPARGGGATHPPPRHQVHQHPAG
jgi:hypothetical protein